MATGGLKVSLVDMSLPEEAAARSVREACIHSGFFYVAQHGVPARLVQDMFEQNKELFALPQEAKIAMLQDAHNRGYTPFAEETLDPPNQTQGDTKEGFYFGREVGPTDPDWGLPLHGPNQWPPAQLLPRYKDVAQAYYDALNALGFRLLRLLALSLGLPPQHFHAFFQRPMVALRPLHYAALRSDPGAGVFGAGAHSDYGMLTILATDDVPGLQIHLDGAWHDVAPVAGAFIINLGDMLERWTNALYRSTLHRVVNTQGRERYSIAFFFEPSFDTRVECLPQCCGPDNPPRFPPTTSGQHLLDKYAATHAGYHAPPAEQGSKDNSDDV